MADSFATRAHLAVNGKSYAYPSLPKLGERFDLSPDVAACVVLDGSIAVGSDVLTRSDALVEPDAVTHLTARADTRLAVIHRPTSAVSGG